MGKPRNEDPSIEKLPQNQANRLVRFKDLQKLWFLVRIVARQKRLALLLVLATVLVSLLSLPMPIILQKVVDAVIRGDDLPSILIWLVAALGLILLGSAVSVGMQYVQSSFHIRLSLELRRKVFRALMNAPMRVLDRLGTGDLTTRLTVDVNEASSLAAGALPSLLTNAVTLVGFLGVMFYLSTTLASFSLVLLPLFVLLGFPLIRRIRERSKAARSQEAGFNEYITEVLRAFNLAKAFSRERGMERRATVLGRHAAETRRSSDLSLSISSSLLGMLGTLGPFAVLGLGGYLAATGVMTPGTLLAFYACLVRVMMPAQFLAQYGMILGKSMAPVDRIMECLTLPEERKSGKKPTTLLPLILKDLRFRYQNEEPLLEKISLTIHPREHLGIAGASGTGKSTLLALLAGLLEPVSGEIDLGGEDAIAVDPHYRRRRILLVHQDQPVLGMSAADNLRLGSPEATPGAIWQTLEKVGLAEVIRKLPAQLEEELGIGGAVLSGGEKARLCLARAMLMQPEALLLDEPFAALDERSAQILWQNMTEALPGTTFVLVSHHPSGLSLVPRIVVLKDGLIVEEGSPQELAACEGEYARLCRFPQDYMR